jgi:hypothetical protein
MCWNQQHKECCQISQNYKDNRSQSHLLWNVEIDDSLGNLLLNHVDW